MIRWAIIAALSFVIYWGAGVLIQTRQALDEFGRENTLLLCYGAKSPDCDKYKVPPKFAGETSWQTLKRAMDGLDPVEKLSLDTIKKMMQQIP